MVAPVGYSDIALSFSPEAFYTGIPGADVSRGMLYGGGKAEKLHADAVVKMQLDEKQREFDATLAQRIAEYDKSMEFAGGQFDFFKEQYADQLGLQKDYLSLNREQGGRSRSGPGGSLDDVLARLTGGGGPSLTPFDLGDRSGVTRRTSGAPTGNTPTSGYSGGASSYYNPGSGQSIGDFLGGIDYSSESIEDSYRQFGDWY